MKQNNRAIYIADSFCISPQYTFNDAFFSEPPVSYQGNRFVAKEPDYNGLIPAGLLRRMGKAIRMGVGAGLPVIQKHPDLEGIILGTANGGLEDCLKFLNQIVDYNEGTLTPTNFVQSTPNAVAGSLALMSKNTGYNATHVHKGLAFENALLDAVMLLEEGKVDQLLVGGIEEISDYNYNIDALAGAFKEEPVTSETLLDSGTPGTVCGEGAAMFVLTANREGSIAELAGLDQASFIDQPTLQKRIVALLNEHGLAPGNIDLFVSGVSGDVRSDDWFAGVQSLVGSASVVTFKNLVGDYPTVSSFALWYALQILQGKMAESGKVNPPKNVLIYNHFRGIQHGLMLLRQPA